MQCPSDARHANFVTLGTPFRTRVFSPSAACSQRGFDHGRNLDIRNRMGQSATSTQSTTDLRLSRLVGFASAISHGRLLRSEARRRDNSPYQVVTFETI